MALGLVWTGYPRWLHAVASIGYTVRDGEWECLHTICFSTCPSFTSSYTNNFSTEWFTLCFDVSNVILEIILLPEH